MTPAATTPTHSSLLDPTSQTVIDTLYSQSRRQMMSAPMLRHYAPRLPSMLLKRPVRPPSDPSLFDDKLLPISAAQGNLLYLLVRAQRPRCVVEFGTSFGVSTIYLAAAMRDTGVGGHVIGTEMVPYKVAQARSNLTAAGLTDHVEIREGDARQTLRELDRPIDFLLLDGWPSLAIEVLQTAEPMLAKGALIAVDNIAHFSSELRSVTQRLSHPPYRSTLLPFKSGTLVSVHDGSGTSHA
ncbi:O-methyltransferase [Mycolicibacterium komossense]|uniref:Class I SAM-dependent methyltransferase n=1 Tax=Mycolicibacterium komossense TaxID=1779 RepID=A0ABT3CF22_9MYCO|nr:class I SAM-dependent methyltransferase [Mycolicibacterium komossense]MCV7228084.1 class I SAM-dependent methyltransferase [Mycolicibacterium komossense]